jgi:hypothetical protein
MKDIECPYCGHEQDVCHDDGFGFEEDVAHEVECHECEKSYVFHTSIMYDYSASKADCLNGSPHDLEVHDGRLYKREQCRDCDYSVREWKKQVTE